jgi:predicted metal-dependent phosphoesterase TrpH
MNQVWSKADIHIHTRYSDGNNTIAEILEHVARHTDLRLIAITDHDTIEGALEARRLAPQYGLEVIVGEEVSTADGHLLALFIEQNLLPGRPAAETIVAAREQGGLCIAAHPYDRLVPSMGRHGLAARCVGPAPEWPLDGIETFNASLLTAISNVRAVEANATLRLAACGGSDSHHAPTIGCGYTMFPGSTAADLRAAILRREVRAGGEPWGLRQQAKAGGLLIWRAIRPTA